MKGKCSIETLEAELADCNQRLTDARGIIKKLTTVDKEYLKQKQRMEAERDKLQEALKKIMTHPPYSKSPLYPTFLALQQIARDALKGGECEHALKEMTKDQIICIECRKVLYAPGGE